MNPLKILFCTAMKCLLIKNTYVNLLLKIIKVFTGLSDFHKMTVTVMKTTFQKLDPKIIHYRDYRKYCN